MIAARLLLALCLCVPATRLAAQWRVDSSDAPAGSDIRRVQRLANLAGLAPWELEPTRTWRPIGPLKLGLLDATIETGDNTGLPYSHRSDGSAWAGRGAFLRTQAGFRADAGIFRLRVAPQLWWTQNADIRLIPTSLATPPSPYSDPIRPRTIDLPQRFGENQVARLDPGESFIRAEYWGLRVSFTTAAKMLGAGYEHSLILQGDAGGFPRVELGTTDGGLVTPIGRIGGTLSSGRLAQTPWAPERRTGARHGSFIDAWWKPFGDERLTLGAARFYHRDWNGWRSKDLLVPFGSLFFDDQLYGDGDVDNQLAMIYARTRIPSLGLDVFAEFGKNDRSLDERDLFIEADHNAAWQMGFTRAWGDSLARLWAVTGTVVGGRISEIVKFRPQATFYDHFPIRQGHTLRGQLLGTPLLQVSGGSELRVDRIDPNGRRALILSTRSLPARTPLPADANELRTEWSAMLEWMKGGERGAWYARGGGIADVGRTRDDRDSYSLHLAVGYVWRPR